MLSEEASAYAAEIDKACSLVEETARRLDELDGRHASLVDAQRSRVLDQRGRIEGKLDVALSAIEAEFETETKVFNARMDIIADKARQVPAELRMGAILDEQAIRRCEFDPERLPLLLAQITDSGFLSKLKSILAKEKHGKARQDAASEYLTQLKAWEAMTMREHDAVTEALAKDEADARAAAKAEMEAVLAAAGDERSRETASYKSQRLSAGERLKSELNLDGIRTLASSARQDYGSMLATPEELDETGVPDEVAQGVFLGSAFHRVGSARLSSAIETFMGDLMDSGWTAVPIHLPAEGSYIAVVEYSDAAGRRDAAAAARALVSRSMASYPVEGLEVSYIDPVERGSSLKYLEALASSPDCSAIRPVAASEDAIDAEMGRLVRVVDELSLRLAMVGSVDDYNRDHQAIIPHRLIVISDFPAGFSRKAVESLKVLMSNRGKCGISFLVTRDASREQEREAKEAYAAIERAADVLVKDGTVALAGAGDPFEFASAGYPENLVDRVRQAYAAGRKVDSSFSRMCDFGAAPRFADSTEGLFIPFAVDRQNEIVTLELGTSSAAHMVITGSTGSGKSTTLHAIIAGLMLTYHPQDVELWLVDYKETEFAEYLANSFPAIKLIGLDKSKEFTYALVDLITDEMLRRASLFAKDHVQDIKAYKKKHGTHSMPRIVIMIDEFHNLTQTIKDDPDYVVKFENILSECRSTGMSCVLSDQSILDGLRGLTEKGKKQLTSRIAMRNSADEVKATLGLDASFYTDELREKIRVLNTGDIVMKRERRTSEGSDAAVEIGKYKSIYVTAADRAALAPYMQEHAAVPPFKPLIVNGQKRSKWKNAVIAEYEAGADGCREGESFLYLGTPSNFNPCFRVLVSKQLGQNVAVLGQDLDRRMSILLCSVMSIMRKPGTRTVVLAHPEDPLYERYRWLFDALAKRVDVVDTVPGICDEVLSLADRIREGERESTFLVVTGYEFLCDEFAMLPSRSDGGKKGNGSAILGIIADLGLDDGKEEPSEDYSSGYDARDDLTLIVTRGCRYGIHTLLSLEKTSEMRKNRQLKIDSFDHRMATQISRDESLEFFGSSQAAKDVDGISAAYSNSGAATQIFRPYLLPEPNER